ncbi:MAG: hypothetical protein U9N02_02945 [Campylobacterota bacterium]|nr:hypothetical protein [Campylobacterota bacterium]
MDKTKELQNIKLIVISISFFIIVLFGVIISYSQYKFIEDDIEHDVNVQVEHIQKNFDLYLSELQNDTIIKSNILLDADIIKKAFYDKDRELLYSLTNNKFQRMTKQNPF